MSALEIVVLFGIEPCLDAMRLAGTGVSHEEQQPQPVGTHEGIDPLFQVVISCDRDMHAHFGTPLHHCTFALSRSAKVQWCSPSASSLAFLSAVDSLVQLKGTCQFDKLGVLLDGAFKDRKRSG